MDSEKPNWYDQLRMGPLNSSSPNVVQIEQIKRSVTTKPADTKRFRRLSRLALVITSLVVILSIGFNAYQNRLETGIQSAAISGSQEWKDLKQAVMDFTNYDAINLVHVEPSDNGAFVFYQRPLTEESQKRNGDTINLSVEYMKKTWNGWKWIHSGGFGSSVLKNKSVYYQYLKSPDAYIHTTTPFPLVYGVFFNESVESVFVDSGDHFSTQAVNFPISDSTTGWFAFLPNSTEEILILAKDKDGHTVEAEKLDPTTE
ncbi:hypothetical protein SD71_04805 [Cohnella kolymensis]|uniref:DUF4367 domain-containing protein n=1 Tax=Cohnella kolymensis TaxID=1590652 RepID=A0ABR5A7M9_9BACL|nr:hypothetical protein [Cohnella kolymensis]KIL37007.1 hypothetical protein SD71_04805 [Cohnella kolymensis]